MTIGKAFTEVEFKALPHDKYEASQLTKEFMDEIIERDSSRINKALCGRGRTATLFRIDYMKSCIKQGVCLDVLMGRWTLENLRRQL